jgi:Cys-rich protein (TIGR01571 family)
MATVAPKVAEAAPKTASSKEDTVVLKAKVGSPGGPTVTVTLAPDSASRRPPGQTLATSLLMRFLYAFAYVLLVCIVALAYQKLLGFQEPPAEFMFKHGEGTGQQSDFYFKLFQCDECCGRDQRICVCAFCCTGIRWAETLSREKIKFGLGFWSLLLFCSACEGLTFLGLTFVFVAVAVYFRQKLRAAFGLEVGTFRTYAMDCFVWFCCAPCAAAQEAREVQYLPVVQTNM